MQIIYIYQHDYLFIKHVPMYTSYTVFSKPKYCINIIILVINVISDIITMTEICYYKNFILPYQ